MEYSEEDRASSQQLEHFHHQRNIKEVLRSLPKLGRRSLKKERSSICKGIV